MSIKTFTYTTAIVLTLAASGSAAFAGPYVEIENQAQYGVSAQESLLPTSASAFAREQAKLQRPSAFNTPGPYTVSEGPFQSTDPHWGPAQDGTDE